MTNRNSTNMVIPTIPSESNRVDSIEGHGRETETSISLRIVVAFTVSPLSTLKNYEVVI